MLLAFLSNLNLFCRSNFISDTTDKITLLVCRFTQWCLIVYELICLLFQVVLSYLLLKTTLKYEVLLLAKVCK